MSKLKVVNIKDVKGKDGNPPDVMDPDFRKNGRVPEPVHGRERDLSRRNGARPHS